MSNNTTSLDSQLLSSDKEIDLRNVVNTLARQIKLITGITSVVILLSGIYAYTRKPLWEGQFQIVLEPQNSGSSDRLTLFAANNPFISNMAGFGNSNQLDTEVKVLKSPSVLRSTYEFVRNSKLKDGDNNYLSYQKWLDNNLIIELEKGTSVLNISYRDTNQQLVLPVIERISRDYQHYSGRDRSKSISNGLSFAKKQVAEFRQKAAKSSRTLDAFSIRYGISNSGNPVNISGDSLLKLPSSKYGPKIGNTVTSMNSVGSVGNQGDALSQLAAVNQELIRRQQRFTSSDPSVLSLIRERDALRHYIEVTAGGSLTLPGQQPLTKEKAQALLLEFKELKRKATRDIQTLKELENTLLSLQLEEARQTDPWELISTPTLLEKPVAPNKKQIMTLGLLGGLLLGCCSALINDRRIGLIYCEKELRLAMTEPLLERLRTHEAKSLTMACELLANGPLKQANTIALVPMGQPDSNDLHALTKALQIALGERSLLVSNDLLKTRECDTQLLIIQPGTCSRNQLSQLQQSLTLQGTPVVGWVLLDPKAEAV